MEEEADNTVADLNGFKLHNIQKRLSEQHVIQEEKTPLDGHSDSADTTEDDVNWEDYIPEPPDGGWGWVICFASFFNNFLVDGIAYCFGVFLAEYGTYFNTNVGSVSLASSLICGFYLFVGPIVAAFVNKWGCRKVGIVGSLIASAAFIISTFSPNITIFQLTYGILGGFGFGLLYLPSVVGVGFYFEKKRALATGIAVCGTGIGTFAMAPFSKYLLDNLDWKNTHYVLAGLLLQGCVSSAVMRPLVARRRVIPSAKNKTRKEQKDEDHGKLLPYKKDDGSLLTVKNGRNLAKSSSALTVAEKHGSAQRLHASAFLVSTQRSINEIKEDLARPMYRKDIFYSGSIYNIPTYKNFEEADAEHIASVVSIPSSEKQYGRLSCLSVFPKPVADILAEMLDMEILRNKSMLLLCLGNLFGMMGFYVPIIFSSDRAVQKGIDKESAALLLSIMGICNTIGRVLSGLMVVFVPKLSPLLVNNISITIAGVAVLLTPFCHTYTSMALAIAAYGLFAATFVSLAPILICELVGVRKLTNGFGLISLVRGVTAIVGPPFEASFISLSPVLVCDYVGLDKLTNGFGLICLIRGVAAMSGPPIEGMLYDLTGDYDATFYMGGACILTSAACQSLLFLKPFRIQRTNSKEKTQPSTKDES